MEYIVTPIATLVLCQWVKFVIESVKARRVKWGRLFNGTGGMPSSHTAFSVSVATIIGLGAGFLTPAFALAMVFAGIIMYDSTGLRRDAGKQAATINQLVDQIFESREASQEGFQHLKEELGHRPLEVVVGLLIGIASAFFFHYVVF